MRSIIGGQYDDAVTDCRKADGLRVLVFPALLSWRMDRQIAIPRLALRGARWHSAAMRAILTSHPVSTEYVCGRHPLDALPEASKALTVCLTSPLKTAITSKRQPLPHSRVCALIQYRAVNIILRLFLISTLSSGNPKSVPFLDFTSTKTTMSPSFAITSISPTGQE